MFYFFFLHFPLSGPVLTNISLPIIPCMIVYVTNNKEPWTLNLEPCLKPYRITSIHWLMAWMPSWTFLYHHPYTGELTICSTDFSAFTKWPYQPFCCGFSGPIFRQFFADLLHLHFGDCDSGTMFSSWWSAWIFDTASCQPPCFILRFIASNDPHSKRVNFC